MNFVAVERLAPQPADEAISDEAGAAMARAAVSLFEKWGLTDAEASTLLGGLSARTYARWKNGEVGRLGIDLKTRLSNLMGIHKALRILYAENALAYAWIRKANADFNGARPLDTMLHGLLADIVRVRNYLDSARG